MRPKFEVCVDSIESAKAAIAGGADRLEVCSSLAAGGLTPSCGLMASIRRINNTRNIPLFSMIRPRSGDFNYSATEIDQMLDEIEQFKAKNLADGFVLGLLLKDGNVDTENCKKLVAACEPLPVTFHRAFDLCSEPVEALESIIQLGFKRVLTSGQQVTAEYGLDVLKMLVERAGDRIIIMPAAGINHMNLETILRETKAKEFHSSASQTVQSRMAFRKDAVSMGSKSQDYSWSQCDEKIVRCMAEVADRF